MAVCYAQMDDKRMQAALAVINADMALIKGAVGADAGGGDDGGGVIGGALPPVRLPPHLEPPK